MGSKSDIQWTDASWSPIRARNIATGKVGWHCEHATTGCEFCYAEDLNKWVGTGLPFKPGHRKGIEIFLDEEMLTAPLRWKKPRMIFVCSMTDAFADFVKDEWLDKMFAVMELSPQHTFQVLTKRAERMRGYMTTPHLAPNVNAWQARVSAAIDDIVPNRTAASVDAKSAVVHHAPLPNCWLGVSAERQQEWDERKDHLRATPATVRFASFEPLLGPIKSGEFDFSEYLDWAIVGGESGPNARPMHPQWARDIRDQCQSAGVAFFFKQWGQWEPWARHPMLHERATGPGALTHNWPDATHSIRVGKKAAGRLLDGVEWNEFPNTQSQSAPALQAFHQPRTGSAPT